MVAKRKVSTKKNKAPEVDVPQESVVEEKAVKPQFVTQVVEELPVNEGVDVSEEALEMIKEKAEQIEEVVEEIQEEQREEKVEAAKEHGIADKPEDTTHEEPEIEETTPVKESPGDNGSAEGKQEENKEMLSELFSKEKSSDILPDSTQQKRIGAAPVFLWAVIIIGVALLTGGTLLVIASGLPKLPTLFVKPTPPAKQDLAPQGTSTPTPTAAAVRGDITVQVLNGGGTSGSAGKAKTFLEKKGYTVAATGNTDEYTYKKTEIHVKAGKEAYLELLKKDIGEEYVISTADAKLAAGSSYDAQVIVGRE